MESTSTLTFGCDLGDRKSHFCVLDGDGEVAERGSFATTRAGIERTFKKRTHCQVVIECGTHSPWVCELLAELGHEVVVANPRRVALIAQSRKKTDRRDAEFLAKLARFDVEFLSPVQHRGSAARRDLAIIRARAALVKARSILVNHVRGVAKSNGARIEPCSTNVFSTRARQQLPEELRAALDPVLDQISELSLRIAEAKAEIDREMPKRHPEIDRLKQVQGVGAVTAATFFLTLEDPKRFARNRHAAAFLGFAPARRQSGAVDPELHISKCGDPMLRGFLVECAQFILSRRGEDSDLKRWGLALAARGKRAAKKRAVIAVARKLAVLLCSLWKSGSTYVPLGYHSRALIAA